MIRSRYNVSFTERRASDRHQRNQMGIEMKGASGHGAQTQKKR